VRVPNAQERRRLDRRNLSYYLPVQDKDTQKIIGHLVDISPVGFLMSAKIPIQTDRNYNLRLDFMEEIAGKASLEFIARSKWCRSDSIQPFIYNAGFEITAIAPDGIEIIKRIVEKYGTG
jgi:hypothetical protein